MNGSQAADNLAATLGGASGLMSRRRALWVLALPMVLALATAGVCFALALDQSRAADAAEARLQASVQRRPQEPVLQAEALMVPGATVGLAASALQAQVLGLISGADVQQIEAVESAADTDSGNQAIAAGLLHLRVNLRITGDEAGVMQSLIALEAAEPLIFVDALRVSGQGDGSLSAEFALSAYARKVAP